MENGKLTNLDNLASAVKADASVKILQFKAEKNQYLIGDNVVPLGTKYYAHVLGWMKFWLKFVDKDLVDRKAYCVARGEVPPPREELDEEHLMGTKDDPWCRQYTLPLENIDTGELIIFQTSTVYGREAVRGLVDEYIKRGKTQGEHQPIIELAMAEKKAKKNDSGKVSAPIFKIVGWDDGNLAAVPAEDAAAVLPPVVVKRSDMDDEIPF
jgi:hypothetical protein